MSSVATYNFENGSDGSNVTAALEGTNWSRASSAAFQYASLHKYNGTLGGHINVTAGSTDVSTYTFAAVKTVVGFRFYGWLPAIPLANAPLCSVLRSGTKLGDLRLNTDGTVSVRNVSSPVATSTTVLATSAFFRIEVLYTPGTSIACKLFVGTNVNGSTADETISGALGGTDIDVLRFGVVSSGPAVEMWTDEWAIDDATYPGPVVLPVSAGWNNIAPSYNLQWGTANVFAAPTGTGDLGSETFEKGSDSAQVTTALCDVMTIQGAASTRCLFSSLHPARGAMGVHFVLSAANQVLQFTPPAAKSIFHSRAYLYLTALPPTAFIFASWSLAGVKVCDVRINVDGTMTFRNAASTAVASTSTPLQVGLNRVEFKVQPGTEMRVRVFVGGNVDGATQDQEINGAITGTQVDQMNIGVVTASTQDFYLDSLGWNDTTWVGAAPPNASGTSAVFAWISPHYNLATPAVTVGNDANFNWVAPVYLLDGTPDQTWVGQQNATAVSASWAWASVGYEIQLVSPPVFAGTSIVIPPDELPLPPGIVADGEYLVEHHPPDLMVAMTSGAAMKQNDLEPDMVFTLKDRNTGRGVDLTLVDTVTLTMTNAATGAVKISAALVTVTDETAGQCNYQWQPGDTDTVGRFHCEAKATWPGARPQTFPTIGTFDVVISADLNA